MLGGRTEPKSVSRSTFDAHASARNAARIESGSYRSFLEQQGRTVPSTSTPAPTTGSTSSRIRSPSPSFQRKRARNDLFDPFAPGQHSHAQTVNDFKDSDGPEHHPMDTGMLEIDDSEHHGGLHTGSSSEESSDNDQVADESDDGNTTAAEPLFQHRKSPEKGNHSDNDDIYVSV